MTFELTRPGETDLSRRLAAAAGQQITYAPLGLSQRAAPPGFAAGEAAVDLGVGDAAFARACEALRRWREFELSWVSTFPKAPPLEPGAHVLVVARYLGLWSINTCRIVYLLEPDVIESGASWRQFGFAYGTLEEHAETGEETFGVRQHLGTGAVSYYVRAVSRERAWLARLGRPFARRLQARFRRDSAEAMRTAMGRLSDHR